MNTLDHCQCDACRDGTIHASDCAVHNAPAYPKGPCDCTPSIWREKMSGKRPSTKNAVEAIQFNLIGDSEYRAMWAANVAMAIYDTRKKKGETAHEWRQRCAEQFIKYLCAGHPDDPTSQLMEAIGH